MKSKQKQKNLGANRQALKPFAGKVFYLDLPSNKTTESLEQDIKELGGTVEKFFSKEIGYLVSHKQEAKYVHSLVWESPVPSPVSGQSSPYLCSNLISTGNGKKTSLGQTDALVASSRGRTLVERVMKEQGRIQMDGILSNAMEWGVKIFYIDDVIAEVKRKKMARSKVSKSLPSKPSVKPKDVYQDVSKDRGGKLIKPFIKVEDSSRHYCPLHLTIPNMPVFNWRTFPPECPFAPEAKNSDEARQQKPRYLKASSEERAQSRKKLRNKKRNGFCECCMVKYNKLTMHLQSERHKTFCQSGAYAVLDKLISNMHHNFAAISTKDNGPKCCVSSVLFVPGSCEEPRQMEYHSSLNLSKTEIESEGSSKSQMRNRSAVNNGQMFKVKGLEMKSIDHLDKCRIKSCTCKATQTLKTRTSCETKAEDAQTHWLNSETLLSEGDCLPMVLPKDTQVKPEDQIIFKGASSSNTLSRNTECKKISECLTFSADSYEDNWRNILQCKTQQDDALTGRPPETKISSSKNFSPAKMFRRKHQVPKPKRQKTDTNIEPVVSNNLNKTNQTLWDLFLSSDDKDVEFHGFED